MTQPKSAPEGALLAIFGAGGHAACVGSAARLAGWRIAYFIDEWAPGGSLLGSPIVAAAADHPTVPTHVAIGIGDNTQRVVVAQRMATELPSAGLATVIHPNCVVEAPLAIHEGVVILAGAVVGPRSSLGRLSLVSTSAVLTHDCTLGEAASIGPGATLCGRTTVGARSVVGASATLREKVSVGADSVVGAASFVNQDLPDRVVAFGTPARVVRSREPDDPYLR